MIEKKINYNITIEEKETLLRYDYLEKCWYVESTVPSHITKFKKQGWEIISQTVNEQGVVQVAEFKCNNPTSISIRSAIKSKKNLTDEQRKKLAERMKNLKNKN